MDKCNFKNGVVATADDFRLESKARIEANQRQQVDSFQVGALSGFICTVSAGTIQITAGEGYVGDVDKADKISTVPLDDPTDYGTYIKSNGILSAGSNDAWASAKYYVCVQALVTDVVSRPDQDKAIQVVREDSSHYDATTAFVYTVAEYAALSPAEQHRLLIVAEINKPLTGWPDGGGTLPDDTCITPYRAISRIMTCTRTNLVTGVEITYIQPGTPEGTGLLNWYVATKKLAYTAPGCGIGTPIDVSAGSGLYTLSSGGHDLIVKVTSSMWSGADQEDALNIFDLYEPPARVASGADRLLRSYTGTGLPTAHNPLGLTVADIGGVDMGLDEHRLTQHDCGIIALDRSVSDTLKPVGAFANPDYIIYTAPVSGELFYVSGKRFENIVGSKNKVGTIYTIKMPDDVVDNMSLVYILIDQNGMLAYPMTDDLIPVFKPRMVIATGGNTPDIEGVFPLNLELATEADGVVYVEYVVASRGLRWSLNGTAWGPYTLLTSSSTFVIPGFNNGDRLTVSVDATALPITDEADTWTITAKPNTSSNLLLNTVVACGSFLYGEGAAWDMGGGSGSFYSTYPALGACDLRSFGAIGAKDLNKSAKDYINTQQIDGGNRLIDVSVPQSKIEFPSIISMFRGLFGRGTADVNDALNIANGEFDTGGFHQVPANDKRWAWANNIYMKQYKNLTVGDSLTGGHKLHVCCKGPMMILLVSGILTIYEGVIFSKRGDAGSGLTGGHDGASYITGAGGNGGDGNAGGGVGFAGKVSKNFYAASGGDGVSTVGGIGGVGMGFTFGGGGGGGGGAGSHGGGGGGAGGGKGFNDDSAPDTIGSMYGGAGGNAQNPGKDGGAFTSTGPISFGSPVWDDSPTYEHSMFGLNKAMIGGYVPGWGAGGGGGAGSSTDGGKYGGGGGQGGGGIYIEARTIVLEGVFENGPLFNVRGGDGEDAEDANAGGGGGGGGGIVFLLTSEIWHHTGGVYTLLSSANLASLSGITGGDIGTPVANIKGGKAGAGAGTGAAGGAGGFGQRFYYLLSEQGGY